MAPLSPRAILVVSHSSPDRNNRFLGFVSLPSMSSQELRIDLQEMQEGLLVQEMQDRACQLLCMFSAMARALTLLHS